MDSADPIQPADPHRDRGLVRLARGLVGDTHAAEDVLQDSWIVARRHPPPLPGRGGGWLRGIVLRVGRNHRRALLRRAAGPSAELPLVELSPTDCAEREQLLETVRVAVEALDEPYRTTIRLRYLEELGYAEISARLGRPEATLRTHVMRGLVELRERFERAQPARRKDRSAALLGWLGRRGKPPS